MTRTDRRRFPVLFATIAALALTALLLSTGNVSAAPRQQSSGICDRTPEVRDAILAYINGPGGSPDTVCDTVTERQLRISSLKIEGYSSASIVPGDFAGIELRELMITNSPLLKTIPANAFSGLNETRTPSKLTLKNNAIETIERGAFSGVEFGENDFGGIDLSGNKIAFLPEGAFEGTAHLAWVGLTHNYIKFLDGNAFPSDLIDLNLHTNNIQRLDPSFFEQLQNLETVNLASNSLSSLDKDLFDNLSNLKYLFLGANELTSLDKDIFEDRPA